MAFNSDRYFLELDYRQIQDLKYANIRTKKMVENGSSKQML